MLVDDDPQRAEWVKRCLEDLGFEICGILSEPLRVLKTISETAPDVVVIDMGSPGRDILESLSVVAQHQPTPVVMFSEEQDPNYIKRAVDAGVSTYLVGSIDPEKVRPIIQVAIAQFQSFQGLKNKLNETRSQLDDRQIVDKAKHHLMDAFQLTEDEAYSQLRKQAMNCGTRVAEVARQVLESDRIKKA